MIINKHLQAIKEIVDGYRKENQYLKTKNIELELSLVELESLRRQNKEYKKLLKLRSPSCKECAYFYKGFCVNEVSPLVAEPVDEKYGCILFVKDRK